MSSHDTALEAAYSCGVCNRPIIHDAIVSAEEWNRISPLHDEGGLLCASCMVDRLGYSAARIVDAHAPSPVSADAVVEACAKVVDDHTPYKRQGTLAAHVTGTAISIAIRALKGTFPSAPEAKSEVAVKALAWNPTSETVQAAETIIGWYMIDRRTTVDGVRTWYWHRSGENLKPCATEDEAKAAAQEHYETRVLSALVDPEGGV